MNAQFAKLLDSLSRATGPTPDDILAFLHVLPEAGTLPSPWETWTLFGLVRHRKRQYWVRDIIHARLSGNAGLLGARGAFGHPEGRERSGSVPGMPEWEYYFHGRGCCLTHKVTGEDIDVDFWDDTAEYFDLFFYTKHLESLKTTEPPERRLLELHPSLCPLRIALTQLLAAGAMVLKQGGYSNPPRIADEFLAANDAIDAFCSEWGDAGKRIWLAASIGDWPAAHDAAVNQPDTLAITGPQAQKCREIWREKLLHESGQAASDALFGLAHLGGADKQLMAALQGPPSSTASAALEIIGQRDDAAWCPNIYALFRRLKPDGESPEPRIWMNSLKFLLRHNYKRDEMLASLIECGGAEIWEGVLLALEHAPVHALPLIRRALRSHIPCNRTEVAAILALIGRPWSLRELLAAMEASDEQDKTVDVRAALLETGDPIAEKAVVAWEARNPHEDEVGTYLEIDGRTVGPFFSMGELRLKDRGPWVRFEMQQLHDRVLAIKHVVPPEPPEPNSWWTQWLGH